MRTVIGTLVLNEMEWLPKLYEQHKNFPGLVKWVFVEAADDVYATVNPERVDKNGLSVDGTTRFLAELARKDPRIVHIPFGLTKHLLPEQNKCPARNKYVEVALAERADTVMVLDADEFYDHQSQQNIELVYRRFCRPQGPIPWGVIFPQRHIWKPALSPYPLFYHEVTGGYWDIPHTRLWCVRPGMEYKDNHNTPYSGKWRPIRLGEHGPTCAHLGFASSLGNRKAKHSYYVARGEGVTDKRQMYVDCRRAFETWAPGSILPHKAEIRLYNGPIPECFK